MQNYLVFSLGGERLAFPLAVVERIVQAVEITPLPETPPLLRGVINVAGEVASVLDLRQLLAIEPRPADVHDHFMLLRLGQRMTAVVVDAVEGVWECEDDEVTTAAEIADQLPCVEALIRRGDEVVVVCKLESVLAAALQSPDLAQPADAAMGTK